MEGIGIADMGIDTAGTDIGTEDIGIGDTGSSGIRGTQGAEEQAREWAAAEANREAQVVGTTRSPQRATLSNRSLPPRTCGMFSYGSFHSRHAQSTPCHQPSTRREGCYPRAEDLELCLETRCGYSWGMARRWRRLMIGGGVVILAIFGLWLTSQKRQPSVDFKLPDGTRMKLMEVSHGNVLQFHKGLSCEKILFSLGPHPLSRFHAYEMSFPSTYGTLGIELRHFNMPASHPSLVNGLIKLTQVISLTNEVEGRRFVFIVLPWKLPGVSTVITEDVYWAFPHSNDRKIHFRLYYTDLMTRVVTTNEFTIRNPAFK